MTAKDALFSTALSYKKHPSLFSCVSCFLIGIASGDLKYKSAFIFR
jgi:hypothetical protein